MRPGPLQSLDQLAGADAVDSSWLCRAARALDELDQSLATIRSDVDGPTGELGAAKQRNPRLARAVSRVSADRLRLQDQARSLRRRLVLVTKDAKLGPELKSELVILTRDANVYFRRVRRVMWESFASSAPRPGESAGMDGPGVVA